MLISLSAEVTTSSWIKDRQKEQNVWKRKALYKVIITKMLALGGDFVSIQKKGDPLVALLAKRARKFRAQPRLISNQGDARTKQYVLKYSLKDPDRYRICAGYSLIVEQEVSFWTRHYWLYDKQEKMILECTPLKRRFYFGVAFSKEGATKLTLNSKSLT